MPAVAEVDELVVLHFASLDKTFTDVLEGDYTDDGEEDKDNEESVSREEDVGRLNLGLEAHTLDAVEDQAVSASLCLSGSSVTTGHKSSDSSSGEVERAPHLPLLLNFDGDVRQLREVGCWASASGTLVPCCHILEELNADDTHGPLEVLGPGGDDGRKRDGAKTDESLCLEITE